MTNSAAAVSSPEETETLIIGGGIAGLACARHLKDAGQPFTLVTDTLGGRMQRSAAGDYLGAAMLNDDHHHMKKYAKKSTIKQPSLFQAYMSLDGSKPKLALLGASPIGFVKAVKAFAPFLKAMRRVRENQPHICITELVASDPLLNHLQQQSAVDFVREHGIEKISDRLLGPAGGAIYMSDWRELNALFFCLGATWIGLGSLTGNNLSYYDWSGVVPKLTKGYEDKIVIDTVTSVRSIDDGKAFEVSSGSQSWVAKNLVLALPGAARVAFAEAVGIKENASPATNVPLHVFHIKGKRRDYYKPGCSLMLGMKEKVPMFFVLPSTKGQIDVLYATIPDPVLEDYYESYEVIEEKHWEPVVQLRSGKFQKLQPKSNVFMIGDHNIGGLEESFLTGLFAANKIIAASRNG